MNIRPYWSLLRLELVSTWFIITIPAAAAAEMWVGTVVPDRPRALPMMLFFGGIWTPITAAWSYNMTFLKGSFGWCHPKQIFGVPLEFSFSRAISRRTIFAAKATMAWLAVGLPVASLLIRGWLQPDGTMYVPVRPAGVTQRVTEAYQRLFPAATLGRQGDLTTLSLPKAGIELAVMICLAWILYMSCLQAAMALVQGRRALTRVMVLSGFFGPPVIVLLSLVPIIHDSSGALHLPGDPGPGLLYWFDYWAVGAAWTGGHLAWLAPAVIAAGFAAWQFSASRFPREEVLS